MNATQDAVRVESGTGFTRGLQHRLVRQLKVQVADWQDTCRDLAAWEDRYLVSSQPSERLAEHSAMLNELEGVGRWLDDACSQPGFADPETAEQVRLTLQDILDSRAMWHGQISEARREEILRDCFHES